MKMTASLDSDIKSMTRYFQKLFLVLQEARAEDRAAPIESYDVNADESQATHHRFSHFIKPDMISNIYSLIDFWMKRICEYHKTTKDLPLSHRDFKGKHDLNAWQKYLTVYAGLDLASVYSSYRQMDNLRKVRNTFIHSGGHVPKERESEFAAIPGIHLNMLLIVIDDSFIWESLDHANKYLRAAIMA